MFTDHPISADEVERARRRMDDRKRAWDRYGCRPVRPAEVTEAEARVREGRAELAQLHTWGWRRQLAVHAVLTALARGWLAALGWFVGGLVGGTAAAVVAVIPAVLLVRGGSQALLVLAVAFAVGFAAVSAALFPSRRTGATALTDLRTRLADRRSRMAVLADRLSGWEKHLGTLRELAGVEAAYHRAVAEHQALVDRLNDRRYQLKHANWRAMRDTDFEDFLAAVFVELGYRVQKTPVTGDQGVDLIVEGKGRRIAVQTKGYHNSVGNNAIQAVYAGMRFYQCQECMAVTNSRFTRAAKALARSVGCRLIEEAEIADLIDGRLL